jgi:hypothetical protein
MAAAQQDILISIVFRAIAKLNIKMNIKIITTSFPGLSYEDEARHEKALVWAGQFCILIG